MRSFENLHLLRSPIHADSLGRTDFHTFTATDAFHMGIVFGYIHIHLTGSCTFSTGYTLVKVYIVVEE